jgi:uncharacterized protein (TIGR03067 family)
MPSDLDRIQGTWRVVSLETDGQTMSPEALDGARIVVKGDSFTSTAMGATYEGTVLMRAGKAPKAFDLLFTAGPEKGNRNPGIYKLDGPRWTICLATLGTIRPKRFATRSGSGIALETLVRDDGARASARKPSRARKRPAARPATTRPPAESGAPTELEGEWAMVSGVFSGKALDPSLVKWCKRITRGGVTSVVAGPQTMLKATFVLESGGRHAAIEYLNLEGASAGKRQAGIYELNGDTLKVCMSAPGKTAPSDFSSKSGDGRSYTTWRLAGR